jgi:hypothetical protein
MTSPCSTAARAAAAFALTAAVAVVAGASIAVSAAQAKDRKPPPLMLEKRGIFWVGGERVPRTEPGSEDSEQMVGQTYVEFSIPYHERRNAPPIVLWPGGGLSGVQYLTTPDGRAGWADFFVRRGYSVYVVDPPGLGRAGASIDEFNRVQMGIDPPSTQPAFSKWDTRAWSEWNQGRSSESTGPRTPHASGTTAVGTRRSRATATASQTMRRRSSSSSRRSCRSACRPT